jgi:hypothetical protein
VVHRTEKGLLSTLVVLFVDEVMRVERGRLMLIFEKYNT